MTEMATTTEKNAGPALATGGQTHHLEVRRHTLRLEDLPRYSRSLLKIRIPIVVTLAQKRLPLGRILEWGPGALIQFDKSCEELLELSAGEHPIALGEAVKVGDKFGLRIASMLLPGERFQPVAPSKKEGLGHVGPPAR